MFEHHRPHPHVHVFALRSRGPLRRIVAGLGLVLFGAGWLLREQGLISSEQLWLIGPAVLALGGVARIALARSAPAVVHGLLALALAAYVAATLLHVGGLSFATTWPVLLIVAGLASIARAVFGRRGGACEEPNW